MRYHSKVMENVTLTIDGRQLSVPKGTSVLKAAIEAGIQVPYYCYHPGLGIDASCRVCLVKIEKMPQAADVVLDAGGRGHGGAHAAPRGGRRPRRACSSSC